MSIMGLINILDIKKFKHKKLIILIFSLQIGLIGSILLNSLGISIPFIRQILGFIILSFIPGILILKILKMDHLEIVPLIIYCLGISISNTLIFGTLINLFFHFLGISNPLSISPLIVTITLEILILCFFLQFINTRSYNYNIKINELVSLQSLFLFCLPILTIFGVYFVNLYKINFILLILLPIIALFPLLILKDKYIPTNLYAYAIFILSISLLFHISLISNYITGYDITQEIYLANLINKNEIWDPSIYGRLNGMPSITILAPIYSTILSMKMDWIFKIIYPIIFAFVPVGLYWVFKQQTNEKIGFLTSFFFISYFVFYMEMIALARQEIAEFFLVAFLVVLIDSNLARLEKSMLLILFGISLTMSHYSISYIILGMIIFIFIIFKIHNLIGYFLSKFHSKRNYFFSQFFNSKNDEIISREFIIFYLIFNFFWYFYLAGSSSINSIVYIGNTIFNHISSDFLDRDSVEGYDLIIAAQSSIIHEISKYLHLMMIFFICLGFLIVLNQWDNFKFNKQYLFSSLFMLGLCLGSMTIPFLASSLNTTRIYHIALIFIAPFCIIGGITILNIISRKEFKWKMNYKTINLSVYIFSILLAIYFLFNSSWIYCIFNDNDRSIALNTSSDGPVFYEKEYSTARWLWGVKDNYKISTDKFRHLLFISLYGLNINVKSDISSSMDLSDIGYIFVGTNNLKNDNFTNPKFQPIISVKPIKTQLNMNYNSGNSVVLISQHPVYSREDEIRSKNWIGY